MTDDEHYFTADPSVAFRREPVRASVWGVDLTLDSGSGVFARGRVDVGTAVLFRETEAPTQGHVLDLGCGYGLIGLATYDEIWSNPPIRVGKQVLHDLLLTWLPRLAPGGRAVMVVGKNLGADSLQRWLGEQGWPTTRLASAKGFRILETRRG